MKKMFQTLFNAALLLSISIPVFGKVPTSQAPKPNIETAQTASQQKKVELVWTTDAAELKKAESLFMESFFEIYSKIPLAKFGNIKAEVDTKAGNDAAITKFLQKAFNNEVEALEKNEILCCIAKINGEVIGFATFEKTKNPEEIYVSQLAVAQEFQGKGIGRQLIFSILEKQKGIKKMVVITRKVNEVAKKFYHAIGFKTSSYMHPDYNPAWYVGYEKVIA